MYPDKPGMGLQNSQREGKNTEVSTVHIELCIDYVVLVQKSGSIQKYGVRIRGENIRALTRSLLIGTEQQGTDSCVCISLPFSLYRLAVCQVQAL